MLLFDDNVQFVYSCFMPIFGHIQMPATMADSPRQALVKSNRNLELQNKQLAKVMGEHESSESDDFVETSGSDTKVMIEKASENQKVGTKFDAEFVVLEDLKDLVHSGSSLSFRVSEKVSECVYKSASDEIE